MNSFAIAWGFNKKHLTPKITTQQLKAEKRAFMRSKDLDRGSYFLRTQGLNAGHLDKKYMLDYAVLQQMPIRE